MCVCLVLVVLLLLLLYSDNEHTHRKRQTEEVKFEIGRNVCACVRVRCVPGGGEECGPKINRSQEKGNVLKLETLKMRFIVSHTSPASTHARLVCRNIKHRRFGGANTAGWQPGGGYNWCTFPKFTSLDFAVVNGDLRNGFQMIKCGLLLQRV